MNRIVCTGTLLALLVIGIAPTVFGAKKARPEKAASKGKASQEAQPCGCAGAGGEQQVGKGETTSPMCICVYFKYAQYFNSANELVHCYFGMYCDADSAGTISYEDTQERPISGSQCSPGCSQLPADCFSPSMKEDRGSKRNGKMQKKGEQVFPGQVAEEGALPVTGDERPAGELMESDEYRAWYVGDDVFARLVFREDRTAKVRLAVIKVKPKDEDSDLERVRCGLGRQYAGSQKPTVDIKVNPDDYIKPTENARATRAVSVEYKGQEYLVLLRGRVSIPRGK